MQEGSPDPTSTSEPTQAGNDIGKLMVGRHGDRKLVERNKKPFLPPLRNRRPPLTAEETKAMLLERAKKGVEKLRKADAKRAARAAKRAEAARHGRIEAGDAVTHRPTGETWFVLGVNLERGELCVAGWPSSIAKLSDCKLEKKGSGLTPGEILGRRRAFGDQWDGDGLYGPDGTLINDGIEHLGGKDGTRNESGESSAPGGSVQHELVSKQGDADAD